MPPSSRREAAIKRARWLLLLPPCMPGALMLLLAPVARSPEAAGQLSEAGKVALAGGLLMAAFITWKILRPPSDGDEEADADAQKPSGG